MAANRPGDEMRGYQASFITGRDSSGNIKSFIQFVVFEERCHTQTEGLKVTSQTVSCVHLLQIRRKMRRRLLQATVLCFTPGHPGG